MSVISNNILTVTEPTIELDTFDIPDIESGNEGGSTDSNKKRDKLSKIAGGLYPAIRINEYDFNQNDIRFFNLTIGDFLPELRVSVTDSRGVFNLSSYPKDGDVLMLYIRSSDEEVYKPIRMDFDIINVDAPPVSNSSQGAPAENQSNPALKPVTYTFECRVKIPGMFTEECKGYDNMSWFDTLLEISESLKIGFASNVDDTSDNMSRICAYDTNRKFILDHTASCYKSDNHFFTTYIDPYYYINLVDINNQMQYDDNLEESLVSLLNDLTDTKNNNEPAIAESKLFLSNLEKGLMGTDKYIHAYSLENNAAEVTLLNGYKRTVQYYDDSDKVYRQFKIDPLTSDNLPDNLHPLRGRNDEDRYKKEVKYKYLGNQSSVESDGNTHENFLYSQVHNFQNQRELDKLYLVAELPKANMGLYCWQKVPIIIYETDAKRTSAMKKKEENQEDLSGQPSVKQGEDGDSTTEMYGSPKINEFLTGVYAISRIEYTYNRGSSAIKQKLRLVRREWPYPT